jgi:hypothetical protein
LKAAHDRGNVLTVAGIPHANIIVPSMAQAKNAYAAKARRSGFRGR